MALLSYIIWLPLIGALILLLFPKRAKISMTIFAFSVSATDFILSLVVWKKFLPEGGFQFIVKKGWITPLGVSYFLGIDGISLFLVILTTFLTTLVIVASPSTVKDRYKEYLFSFLLLETAILGSFLSLDLFLFFLFWELTIVPIYIIIGVWGGERKLYATLKFFLYTMAGSIFMLVSILYLVITYHELTKVYSFDYFELKRVLLPLGTQILLFLGFSFSFVIKIPLFPLHTWLPDAHVEAPTAGSVILAGILLKLGVYGLIRFSFGLFPYVGKILAPILVLMALVGIIYSGMIAWMEEDIKRVIAYSSIGHLGFVVLGLCTIDIIGLSGSIYQMLSHGITTATLFLLVGIIYERTHTRLIHNFGGVAKLMPNYAVIFMITLLASIGLPGLSGFVGEFLILMGIIKSEMLNKYKVVSVVLGVFGIIIATVYMLELYMKLFFGELRQYRLFSKLKDLSLREYLYLLPLVFVMIVMGFFPQLFLKEIKPSLLSFKEEYLIATEEMEKKTTFINEKGEKVLEFRLPLKQLKISPPPNKTAPMKKEPIKGKVEEEKII